MSQLARNLTDASEGFLRECRYLIHDRSSLFTEQLRGILKSGGVECLRLPARLPNLNALAERFVRTIKESCLDSLILLGEPSLRRAVSEFVEHYHGQRNHQGAEQQDHQAAVYRFPADRNSPLPIKAWWHSPVLLPRRGMKRPRPSFRTPRVRESVFPSMCDPFDEEVNDKPPITRREPKTLSNRKVSQSAMKKPWPSAF